MRIFCLFFLIFSLSLIKAQNDTIVRTVNIDTVYIKNLKNISALSNKIILNNIIPAKTKINTSFLSTILLPKNKNIKIVALELNFDIKNDNNITYNIIPQIFTSIDDTKNLIGNKMTIVYETKKINSILIHFDEEIVLKNKHIIFIGCKFINKNIQEHPFIIRAYKTKNKSDIYHCNQYGKCNKINDEKENYTFNYKIYYKILK